MHDSVLNTLSRVGELYPFLVATTTFLLLPNTEDLSEDRWLLFCLIGAVLLSILERWSNNYEGFLVVCVVGVMSSMLYGFAVPNFVINKPASVEFLVLIAVILLSLVLRSLRVLELGFSIFAYVLGVILISNDQVQPQTKLNVSLVVAISTILTAHAIGNKDYLETTVLLSFIMGYLYYILRVLRGR